jgi:hypothetical protein
MGSYPQIKTASTVIAFDNPVSVLPDLTITGAVTFTKSTSGQQPTWSTKITIIADGTHMPDFSAFDSIGTGAYDNTSGVKNICLFTYWGYGLYTVTFTPVTVVGGGGGGDTTPPSTTSVSVEDAEPNKVLIAYGETLDSGSVPATSAYTVTVNGTTRTVSAVAITGANVKVTFGGAAVVSTDTITLDYVVPGSNPVQDVAGNDATSLSGVTADNNVSGGATLTDLNFATATALSHTGTVWTSTDASGGGTYVAMGLADKKLAAANDGYIMFDVPNDGGKDVILGFNTTNANEGWSSFEAGISLASTGSEYYRVDGGSIGATSIFGAAGDKVRILVTSSVVKAQKSTDGGTTWTDIYTYSFTRSADLFIGVNMDAGKALTNPKGYNLS